MELNSAGILHALILPSSELYSVDTQAHQFPRKYATHKEPPPQPDNISKDQPFPRVATHAPQPTQGENLGGGANC